MKKSLLLIIPFLLFSCEGNEPADQDSPQTEEEKKAIVIQTYELWATSSANKDKATMYRLSYPGGNFEGMTNVCIDQWEGGNQYFHFRFKEMEVLSIDRNGAIVDGIDELIQGPPNGGYNGSPINYIQRFRSNCVFDDGKVLLDGHNNYEDLGSW